MQKENLQLTPQKQKDHRRLLQLYANKMDNLEQKDTFLEMYSFPRLNNEQIENMNRPITSNEIKSEMKQLPTNKSLGPDCFTGEFYKTFREELTSVPLKLFQKFAEEGMLLNSFYETSITLITNTDRDITKMKIISQ